MGEYIKYQGSHVKLGTCESLYYSTYQQFISALKDGQLFHLANNDYPANYARPDSGYRFRFPFPDEKGIPIGRYSDFDRGVEVVMEANLFPEYKKGSDLFKMEILQQKLAHREADGKLCLMLVWRDPENRESYRIEDDNEVKNIIKQIAKHHIVNNPDAEKKRFFREIAVSVMKGYNLPKELAVVNKNEKKRPDLPPAFKHNQKLGKGI